MTLEDAQNLVDSWVKQYGVRYFSELTNMAILTEEVGEVARIMARKYGDQSAKKMKLILIWLMNFLMCCGFCYVSPIKPE